MWGNIYGEKAKIEKSAFGDNYSRDPGHFNRSRRDPARGKRWSFVRSIWYLSADDGFIGASERKFAALWTHASAGGRRLGFRLCGLCMVN